MPGISLIACREGMHSSVAGVCAAIRKNMLHFPDYVCQPIMSDGYTDIGFTGYKNYPKRIIDTPAFCVVLEGMIYSEEENSLDEGLREVGKAFVQSKSAPPDALKRFLLKADGELILLLYNKKSNRILIANDVLGRLPLYYFHDRQMLAVARELKFILPFLPKLAFHRLAVMEYVLLGYPFGENTLIERVGFFPGGSYLIFDLRTGESIKDSYHVLNFVERGRALTRATAVTGMRRVFLDALDKRVRWTEKNKIIVSLSGGLDSRGVLAGLKRLGCNPSAVTFRNDEEGTARDVAKAIGTDVYSIEQHVKCGGLEFDNVVFLKDGLDCGPNISQLCGTLQDLKDSFGKNMVYYNGAYGGEILRLGHLPKNLHSFDSLVAYLLHSKNPERFSTDKVARIFGLTPEEIAGHLARHLRAFPEQDIYRKYVQFGHERNIRRWGESNDRNRYYFWTITPYYSFPFFQYLIGMDEDIKDTRLFIDFLRSIDPNTCAVKYYNYRLPLNVPLLLQIFGIMERGMRHAKVRSAVLHCIGAIGFWMRLISGQNEKSRATVLEYRKDLSKRLDESEVIREFFDNPGLQAIIDEETSILGLERLRIIFAALSNAGCWVSRFAA